MALVRQNRSPPLLRVTRATLRTGPWTTPSYSSTPPCWPSRKPGVRFGRRTLMNDESSVPGVSLEAMVAMSVAWEATTDPDAERARFALPRNAGALRLVVHRSGERWELTVDY